MDAARIPLRPQEQGIALLLVIWALALLSAIAVAVTADGRSVRRIAHNLEQAARDRALVEGGIRWGMAQLLDGRPERRLPLDGRPLLIEIDTRKVEVAVEAETGKFDLNTSPPAVLENLLLQSGATAAEARRVSAAVEGFRKANRPEPGGPRRPTFLETLDLRRVTGLDEELYRQILPYITVYSGTARLDPAVAPKQVLLAVPGLTESQVEAAIRARQQSTTTPAASLNTGAASTYIGPSRPTIFRIRSSVQSGANPLVTGSAIVELTGRPSASLHLHDWMLEAR
jgi:general secretion pathway protein K